jgi:hypothetical protein
MKFEDIPTFITDGSYEVNISLNNLEKTIREWVDDKYFALQVCPDFQRGHIWSMGQQVNFVEFFLQGGKTGRVIYFNKPSWQNEATTDYDEFVIIDGLQRITALRMFMTGKLKVFGLYLNEFEGRLSQIRSRDNLKFNINSLQTKREVLEWYLQLNTGGVVHSASEIERVKELLRLEKGIIK